MSSNDEQRAVASRYYEQRGLTLPEPLPIDELRSWLLEQAREADGEDREDDKRQLLQSRWALEVLTNRLEQHDEFADENFGRRPERSIEQAEQAHRHRAEFYRLLIALLLVAALFAVVIVGVFIGKDSETITQAAAPVAGLAGIAVGWLFGGVRRDNVS